MKTIRDAVHGDIRFTAPEMAVIDSPALQRLRGIKQLGAASLVFPSAVHTRFEHSLGACWLTKRLLDNLRNQGEPIPDDQSRAICLAALLHDITHVPYGHTFEDERRLFDRHDEDADRLDYYLQQPKLAQALISSGVADQVRAILAPGKQGSAFQRQVVTGAVCADLLDYLKRDAYFCGLSLSYDDRLFQYFHLDRTNAANPRLVVRLHKENGFRRDALSELIHLLQMRYTLTERVYYHHAKVVAGAMISRALELGLEANLIDRHELFDLRDDSFLDRLWTRSHLAAPPRSQPTTERTRAAAGLVEVLEDLNSRRLYKRVYLLAMEGFGRPGLTADQRDALADRYHSDLVSRRDLERHIADRLSIPESHVIVYCPAATMSLKEADVPVEIAPGRVEPLSALNHPDVDALSEKHRGLWRFYVLLRRDHEKLFPSASAACEDLIHHPNQLLPLRTGKLAFG